METVDQEELLLKIKEQVRKIRSYTPRVGVFGNSGVGKSSLCNALFGKEVAKISDVEACTREPQEILIGDKNGHGGIVLIDVPGIGEDPDRHIEYTKLYQKLVPELDLVLWAIKADDRNYASGLDAYNTVFNIENKTPVIFAITQSDKTNDTEDWNYQEYRPGPSQLANIAIKENDVSKRFEISTKHIVSVAVSKKGASYNLTTLMNRVVEALPNEKKYSATREAKEEHVSQEAREDAERGIWESVKEMAGNAITFIKDRAVEQILSSAPKILTATVGRILSWFR